MQLLGSKVSQPTRACLWFCLLNELPVEFVNVDGSKGDNKSSQYLSRNPNGTFPVLVDGAFALYESCSILRYLCNKYKLDSWYPTDLQTRARVDQWLDWHHSTLRTGAAGLLRQQVMAKVLPSVSFNSWAKEVQEIPEQFYRRKLSQALDVLDLTLSGAQYLAGTSEPTLADILLVCEIVQLELLSPEEQLPSSVQTWKARLVALPQCTQVHDVLSKFTQYSHKKLQKLRSKL